MHAMRTPEGGAISWGAALRIALSSAALWVPLTMLALWAAARFPIDRDRVALPVLAHLAGALFVTLLRAGAVALLNPWVGWYAQVPPADELLITSAYNNVLVYLLLVGVGHAIYYARTARLQRAQLAEAQLHVLESQLRPHFLFNALNTIVAHIRTSPATAERIVEQLSVLLRNSLESSAAHEVTLQDELNMLEPYLEIEQARFEDRLTIRREIDDETLDALVPHLVLQPLVENAVRHGLARRAAPGLVLIRAFVADGMLHIHVGDNGGGFPAEARSQERWGIGLRNTADRLKQLYGNLGAIELHDRPGGGTDLRLRLPLRRSARASARQHVHSSA